MPTDERNPNDKGAALTSGPGTSWWRKRRSILGVFLSVLVLGIVVFWFANREPAEPVYHGKKLSEWLEVKTRSMAPVDFQSYEQSADAVRHIGTSALPYLLQWIVYEPTPWKQELIGFASKLPGNADGLVRTMLYRGRDRRCLQAILGFQMLGSMARDAEPELVRLTMGSSTPATANRAKGCLICIRVQDDLRPPRLQ